MKKGEIYKGFEVLDVKKIAECSSIGIYLKHKESGLEVFHLLNKDPENLFSFAFNTPPSDSTGAAHVIEHSVLCGSKKFPLKDPFIQLANQSVNTYLNAYTSSSMTVYPASSFVKSDYYNLMAVYADAVFFPLLKKETFAQECCRVEFDKNNKPSLQGVVYNEMKGVFSSFTYAAAKADSSSLSKDSFYRFTSGGDPLEIPSLTYKDFKAFHKKYYCTANCRVFLYGNIATEEQLDFLEENVISKCKSWGKSFSFDIKNTSEEIEHFVEAYGPCEENSEIKNIVDLNWQISAEDFKKNRAKTIVELLFLVNTLFRNDASPLGKVLQTSGLGDDLSPNCGCDINRLDPIITVGMTGVEKEKAKELYKIVIDELERICRDGFSKEEFETSLMSFEFSNKEILRLGGPVSLRYMRQSLRGWAYGEEPWNTLCFQKEFEKLKKTIAAEPCYIADLIKKYFLDNPLWTLVTSIPSPEWNKKREEEEKNIIKEKINNSSVEELKKIVKEMNDYQDKPETKAKKNCIPHLKISSLEKDYDFIKTEKKEIKGINFYSNKKNTNGITYVSLYFPADVLKTSDYIYLSLFTYLIGKCGWKGVNWDEGLLKLQNVTGSFFSYTRNTALADNLSDYAKKNPLIVGREWVVISFKYLDEYAEKAFLLLEEMLNKIDFKDTERISNLINARYTNMLSSLISYSPRYADLRSLSNLNRCGAVNEIWEGYTQFLTVKELTKMPVKKLCKKFKKIFSSLKKGGCLFHVTSDAKGINKAFESFSSIIKSANLKALKMPEEHSLKDFYALTEIKESQGSKIINKEKACYDEVFLIPGSVGYASALIESAYWESDEALEEDVFCHYLETGDLWTKIRTQGGAYGVSMNTISNFGASSFSTYRDPKPFKSVDLFFKMMKELSLENIDSEELEKAIVGIYSDIISPETPFNYGVRGLLRELTSFSNEYQKRRVDLLYKISAKELCQTAMRYKNAEKKGKTVVFAPKKFLTEEVEKRCGKIIVLPL